MFYSQNLKNLDWKLEEHTGPNSVGNSVYHIVHMKTMAIESTCKAFFWSQLVKISYSVKDPTEFKAIINK